MATYARWVSSAASSRTLFRCSTTDLRHVLRRLDEPWLVDQVSFLFVPDGVLDHRAQRVVGRTRAHQVTQRCLLEGEQAGAQAALGGQADAVARGAERLADRRDEADAARRAVGEFEPRGWAGAQARERDHGEEGFDLV